MESQRHIRVPSPKRFWMGRYKREYGLLERNQCNEFLEYSSIWGRIWFYMRKKGWRWRGRGLCLFFFFCHASGHAGMQDLSSPYQGWNPCPLQWKCGVITTGPTWKSRTLSYIFVCLMFFTLDYSMYLHRTVRKK